MPLGMPPRQWPTWPHPPQIRNAFLIDPPRRIHQLLKRRHITPRPSTPRMRPRREQRSRDGTQQSQCDGAGPDAVASGRGEGEKSRTGPRTWGDEFEALGLDFFGFLLAEELEGAEAVGRVEVGLLPGG